jgi:hypothetical protein
MARRPQYYATGQLMGYVDDGEGDAPSGDPLGAQNRATMLAQRQAAQDAQERERDRQFQAGLLAQQQQFAGQRDVYDAQQRAALQTQTLGAQAQAQQGQLQQHDADSQRAAEQQYRDWMLRGYEGEQNRAQQDQHFQQTGAEQAYQFDAAHAQRAQQFEESRQPSQRDAFEADRRMTEMQAAQQFQAQEMQARFKLQSDLHEQTLGQEEKMRLQRMQTGLAKVQADLDAGRIEPWMADEARSQLQYGISPLKERAAKESVLRQQQLDQLHYAQTLKEMQMQQTRADFDAKTFQERVGSYTDPQSGQTLRFYQKRPGEYDFLPDKQAEQQQMQDERLYKFQDAQMRHHEQQSKSVFESQQRKAAMWDKADQANRKRLEDMIEHDRKQYMKGGEIGEERKPEDAPRANQLQADLDKNHEADMRRHFKLITGQDAQPDVPAELQFRQWLDRTHQPPPPPQPYVPTNRRPQPAPQGEMGPPAPTNRYDPQTQQWSRMFNGQAVDSEGPPPAAAAPTPQAQAPAAPPPVQIAPQAKQAAMGEFDNLAKMFRGGKESEQVTRARELFDKYGSPQNMPMEERVQFLGIMTNLKRIISQR